MRSQWAKSSRAFLKLTTTHFKSSLINTGACRGTKEATTAGCGVQPARFWHVCIWTDGSAQVLSVPEQGFDRLCCHLAAMAKENVYSASQSISTRAHSPFTVHPLQHFLILPCYMLYLLPSNFPPPAQRSAPPALSSLSLYHLHYPTPLFLHPLSLSLPFSFPLCALDRLALSLN